MVSSGYDASDAGHKTLLLSLMMTACDLSDQGHFTLNQTLNW